MPSDFYPRVQGHEIAAIVEDACDSAHEANTRVAIWPLLPCGRCHPCRENRPNVCPAFRLVGVHLDGGLQERLEVPAEQVFGVGDLDPDSASFVEPASVAVHALARGYVRAGQQVVVLGAGPIGGFWPCWPRSCARAPGSWPSTPPKPAATWPSTSAPRP